MQAVAQLESQLCSPPIGPKGEKKHVVTMHLSFFFGIILTGTKAGSPAILRGRPQPWFPSQNQRHVREDRRKEGMATSEQRNLKTKRRHITHSMSLWPVQSFIVLLQATVFFWGPSYPDRLCPLQKQIRYVKIKRRQSQGGAGALHDVWEVEPAAKL